MGYMYDLKYVAEAWGQPYERLFDDGSPPYYDTLRNDEISDVAAIARSFHTIYTTFMPAPKAFAYPPVVYLDEDLALKAQDIRSALVEYVHGEFVKFIRGTRDINDSELADFFATLERLGVNEALGYYTDAFS